MKLIVFDQFKNVTYYGKCKLIKNEPEESLTLTLSDKNGHEQITLPYDGAYICQNNYLCYLNNQESSSYCILIFPTQGKCEQIYNAIVKFKSKQLQSATLANEDKMFKDNFFIPLIKQVQAGINGPFDLEAIFRDLVNSFDITERRDNMTILATTLPSEIVKPEKIDTTSETLGTSFNSSMNYNTRKRSFKNISYKESDDEKNGIPQKAPRRNSDLSNCFEEPSPHLLAVRENIYDAINLHFATTSSTTVPSSDAVTSMDVDKKPLESIGRCNGRSNGLKTSHETKNPKPEHVSKKKTTLKSGDHRLPPWLQKKLQMDLCKDLVLPAPAFQRNVKAILRDLDIGEYKIQSSALLALQDVTEEYLVGYFEDLNILAHHANRVTVMPKDAESLKRLRL